MFNITAALDSTLDFNSRLHAVFANAVGRPVDVDSDFSDYYVDEIPTNIPSDLAVVMFQGDCLWLLCRLDDNYFVYSDDDFDSEGRFALTPVNDLYDAELSDNFMNDLFSFEPAWAYYGSIVDSSLNIAIADHAAGGES